MRFVVYLILLLLCRLLRLRGLFTLKARLEKNPLNLSRRRWEPSISDLWLINYLPVLIDSFAGGFN